MDISALENFKFEVWTLTLWPWGQNGPLALILEIIGSETLFRKYLGEYHFLWYSKWYSSLVSSSTIKWYLPNYFWNSVSDPIISKINANGPFCPDCTFGFHKAWVCAIQYANSLWFLLFFFLFVSPQWILNIIQIIDILNHTFILLFCYDCLIPRTCYFFFYCYPIWLYKLNI